MSVLASLLSLLVPVIAAAGTIPAGATPSTDPHPTRGLVIVLHPADAHIDELTRAALARVTGELRAARFQVTVFPLDPNQDPTPQVESIAPESQAVAALAIAHVSDVNRNTIAIWVSDRLGRRTTISRMAMRGDNVSQDAEVLALEAIELIRGSIAGLWPTPARSPDATGNGTSDHAPNTENLGPDTSLGLGIAMLRDFDVPSSQWMGSLSGMVLWPRGLAVHARVTGLGPASTLSGNYGTAAVTSALAAVGVAWVFRREHRIQPLVTMAVGAHHLTVNGAAPDPTRAHVASAWSPVAIVGCGAAVRLGAGISLGTELNLVVSPSRVNVVIADTETKPFSRPAMMVNVGLHAGF